jgi:RND family efflux transporter MFP subunit
MLKGDIMQKMVKSKKLHYASVVIVAAALFFCFRTEKEISGKVAGDEIVRPVKYMIAEPVEVNASRTFPGRVQASQRVNLAFQVSGALVEFPVKEGMPVKKGQMLAKLDRRDYYNSYIAAKAQYEDAEASYNRIKTLYEKKVSPKADLDAKKAVFDTAKSSMLIAQKAYEDTVLRAPFDGVIAKKYVENFQDVNAKEAVLSLQDVSSIEIAIDIPEKYMVKFKKASGFKATANFDAIPEKDFSVKISEFSTEASSTTQTFSVILKMDAPEDYSILPGMTSSVTFTGMLEPDTKSDLYSLPLEAMFSESDKSYVWKINKDTMTVSRQEVKIADSSHGDEPYIIAGISKGEYIVTAGTHFVRNGMKVKLLKTSEK